MIYLYSSVALSHLVSEQAVPPASLWRETLISSRLLEFEVLVQLNARNAEPAKLESALGLLDNVAMMDMSPRVVERLYTPLPVRLRTLDAIHLATMHYLVQQGQTLALASYDKRLLAAAAAIGVPAFEGVA